MNKCTYLLVVDYFSKYVEVQKLSTTTAANVIAALKSIFSRHGIPSILVSDNGPQYSSYEMKEFAGKYGFQHVTSSPLYPQANGQAERAVKTVKQLLGNAKDPHMALLSYRATPLPSVGLSPAELLMGRRIKTDIPQLKKMFIPSWPHLEGVREKYKEYKQKQKEDYDRHHRVHSLPSLPNGSSVWVDTPTGQESGKIVGPADSPRSYHVEVPSGEVRRNRSQLRPRTEAQSDTETAQPHEETMHPNTVNDPNQSDLSTEQPIQQQNSGRVILTRSKTGSTAKSPEYFRY